MALLDCLEFRYNVLLRLMLYTVYTKKASRYFDNNFGKSKATFIIFGR